MSDIMQEFEKEYNNFTAKYHSHKQIAKVIDLILRYTQAWLPDAVKKREIEAQIEIVREIEERCNQGRALVWDVCKQIDARLKAELKGET